MEGKLQLALILIISNTCKQECVVNDRSVTMELRTICIVQFAINTTVLKVAAACILIPIMEETLLSSFSGQKMVKCPNSQIYFKWWDISTKLYGVIS